MSPRARAAGISAKPIRTGRMSLALMPSMCSRVEEHLLRRARQNPDALALQVTHRGDLRVLARDDRHALVAFRTVDDDRLVRDCPQDRGRDAESPVIYRAGDGRVLAIGGGRERDDVKPIASRQEPLVEVGGDRMNELQKPPCGS